MTDGAIRWKRSSARYGPMREELLAGEHATLGKFRISVSDQGRLWGEIDGGQFEILPCAIVEALFAAAGAKPDDAPEAGSSAP